MPVHFGFLVVLGWLRLQVAVDEVGEQGREEVGEGDLGVAVRVHPPQNCTDVRVRHYLVGVQTHEEAFELFAGQVAVAPHV